MYLLFIFIGVLAGLSAGLFGIGGGVIIVPLLVYLGGFSQHMATGTSLAILLPPVGLAATLEYYRHGNVDLKAALVIALSLFVTSWVGATFANRISATGLKAIFGVFLVTIGIYVIYDAVARTSQA